MIIRSATDDDMGFIYETFLRSFRAASTHAEDVGNDKICLMLESLIRKGWTPLVADAEGYLAGWIVATISNGLAWIYVRDMFRWRNYKDHAVRDLLLTQANVSTSGHIVTPFLPNRMKRKWQFVHRPFLVIA